MEAEEHNSTVTFRSIIKFVCTLLPKLRSEVNPVFRLSKENQDYRREMLTAVP